MMPCRKEHFRLVKDLLHLHDMHRIRRPSPCTSFSSARPLSSSLLPPFRLLTPPRPGRFSFLGGWNPSLSNRTSCWPRYLSTSQQIPPYDAEANTSLEMQSKSTADVDRTNLASGSNKGSSRAASSKGKSSRRVKPNTFKASTVTPGPIQLLQLRNIQPRDTIEQHFDSLAFQTELLKLKFVSKLRDKLMELQTTQDDPKNANTSQISYWKSTQKFMDGWKSLPGHVKNGFWNLIVAPTTGKKRKQPSKASDNVSNKDIEILIKARDKAVRQPIFWSHKEKHQLAKRLATLVNDGEQSPSPTATTNKRQQQQDAMTEYQSKRATHLATIHQAKTPKVQQKEARQLAHTLRSKLPNSYYQKVLSALDEFSKERSSRRIFHLQQPLIPSVRSHLHKVAPEIVDFLYVTTPSEEHGGAAEEGKAEGPASVGILSNDEKVAASQIAWMEAREEFVDAFQEVQSLLLEEHHARAEATRVDEGQEEDFGEDAVDLDDAETATVDWTVQDEDDSDDEADETGIYDDSEESVMMTYQQAAKTPTGYSAVKKNPEKPRRYIVFEAISIEDMATEPQTPHSSSDHADAEKSQFSADNDSSPTSRLVFIDNLPVDISEKKLLDAYSRCGPIEKIEVYQQRPDLDPGRKLEDSKKKIRKPSMGRRTWQRPRTPVYASILYRDEAGAQKATGDPLRIFGMVIDRHLIRSHRASDMTKLFLEDISPKHDVSSIEYQLSHILHPNLYVCLDIERGRQKPTGGSLSCEIKFQNFEAAYWAHSKLKSELEFLIDDAECSVQWYRTPQDAILYWTRQLNF